MDIIFLNLKEIVTIHGELIKRFGGLNGIRDKNLLESALYQPQITIAGQFAYQSIFEMAAAYAFGIIKNHAFIDGNKRTGMIAAFLFLKRNNIIITLTNDDFFRIALEIATSTLTQKEFIKFLEKSCH